MSSRTLSLDDFVGTCPFRLPTVVEMCAAQCPRPRCTGKGSTKPERVTTTAEGLRVDLNTGEILADPPTPAQVCGASVYGMGSDCGYVLVSGCCPRHGRRTDGKTEE